ncbi:hypothetical protein B296_00003273 [Ensete ventricosum]|uniref:Uncharacterized protein n=1 Tax=Ensete ventricosum TaxID=4639 RepID=A0A427B8M3_ENSVE|nr:hypothetical protein B296_00003273 [Ensete ventricosum]
MEKAIDRQRVLLQHLRPSPSSSPNGSPLISPGHYFPLLILDNRLRFVPLGTVRLIRGTPASAMTSWLSRNCDLRWFITSYVILLCALLNPITICNSAYRTAICKSKRGGFKDTYPEELLTAVLKVNSHRKAAAATAAGKFKEEIIPVTTKVSDGAGAVLLMRRDVAMRNGFPILGVFRSFAAVGVDPAVMGVGPAVAIPAAVKSAGLQIEDIDLFEINEVI